MSDLIMPPAYTDRTTDTTTSKNTLDDFRKLTMNRNHNKGSLVATKGGLKCVDHHVFKPLNGFGSVKPDEAIRVRRLFVTAAQSELTTRFGRLIDSEAVLHPDNVNALKQKIKELNQAISDMFLPKEDGNHLRTAFSPLKREDVKNFILNIELLNANATADRLMNMSPGELLDLYNPANREKAEKFENQTGHELRKIIENGEKSKKLGQLPTGAKPADVAKPADAKKTNFELMRAVEFAHNSVDPRCNANNFAAIVKITHETILKKLCPELSSPSTPLADAVKKYNDIFARYNMTLSFTEDGMLKCADMNSLPHDCGKLLGAFSWNEDLRTALGCKTSDEEALEVVKDFHNRLNALPKPEVYA